jgi:hypothetical protein
LNGEHKKFIFPSKLQIPSQHNVALPQQQCRSEVIREVVAAFEVVIEEEEDRLDLEEEAEVIYKSPRAL